MSAGAPMLRSDLTIVPQVFRNEESFVVKDPTTHGYFRFRPIEIRVMRLFDGLRSAEAIAEQLVADGLRITASTVDGFARKLSKLGLLERTLQERTTQQLERLRSERRRQRSLIRGELFRLRFSFGDPDRFLTRTYPLVRWCFTPAFVVVSIAMFATYLLIVGLQGRAYAEDVAASFSFGALSLWSIAVFLGVFTVLTAIHELGHAYACKHFGGEVHEMGFMLIFFMPAFYANVNDAWSFPERRARLWVTAAGPWIELFVTAWLAVVWLVVQPTSMFSQVALATMLVGGIGNILTNMNPLLPLDGYFALGDWLEITNLRQRAREYATASFRRHILRRDVPLPAVDASERRILLGYGVASTAYVTAFLLLIARYVIGSAYRTLGLLFAALLFAMVCYLMRRMMQGLLGAVQTAIAHVWRALRTFGTRGWRRGVAVGGALLLALLMAVIPVDVTAPGRFTVAPVTALSIAAPSDGVIADVFVREGDAVAPGSPVMRLADFALPRDALQSSLLADSLAFLAQVARARAMTGASDALRLQSASEDARTESLRARREALHVRAAVGGQVVTPYPERLVGRRVQFGEPLLQIADLSQVEAIIRLTGAGAAEVRAGAPVKLLTYRNTARAMVGVVEAVAPSASAATSAMAGVEARVRLTADAASLVGATGEARVVLRRTTIFGAIVWSIRSGLRADLLL